MSNQIKITGAEFVKSQHKVEAYSEFLCAQIEAFLADLDRLKERGIQDEYIDARIDALHKCLDSLPTATDSICTSIANYMGALEENIEDNDTFHYPAGMIDKVKAILSVFI